MNLKCLIPIKNKVNTRQPSSCGNSQSGRFAMHLDFIDDNLEPSDTPITIEEALSNVSSDSLYHIVDPNKTFDDSNVSH